MRQTQYINLIGGPGSGKTTLAHGLTFFLSTQGRLVEFVGEAARDYIYRNIPIDIITQEDIAREQAWQLSVPRGKVDFIVTDCPLFTQAYYCKRMGLVQIEEWLLRGADELPQINFFIERSYKFSYNPANRLHSEEEARAIDEALRGRLDALRIPYLLIQDLSSLTFKFDIHGPFAKGE